jgi:hypothetical protein
MRDKVLHIIKSVWRGAWRPQPLPPDPPWYDHVGHWPRRLRDIIAGALIFMIPPALAFLVYENFAGQPWRTFWVALLIGAIWLFAASMAYVNGRKS